MHLIYLDESGNSGNNLTDPQQPVFVLGALIVPETKWVSIETSILQVVSDYFDGSIADNFEIHATDIRNGTRHFKGVPLKDRVDLRDKLIQIAIDH